MGDETQRREELGPEPAVPPQSPARARAGVPDQNARRAHGGTAAIARIAVIVAFERMARRVRSGRSVNSLKPFVLRVTIGLRPLAALACGGTILFEKAPASDDHDAGGGADADTLVGDHDGSRGHPVRDASTIGFHDGGTLDANTTKKDAHASSSTGDCAADFECGPNGKCVELVPGGFRVCGHPPPAPQLCNDAGGPFPIFPDECCGTCATGTCTLATYCGGPFINPHNVCAVDACTGNADCGPKGICLPAGVGDLHARSCLRDNECLHDTECTAAPGGACILAGENGPKDACVPFTCGGDVRPAKPLQCVYPGDCRGDMDCNASFHCEEQNGRLACAPGVRTMCPPPP